MIVLGFKWLGNKSIELREQGLEVVFAYEEALGYCLGSVVADKDGVGAAAATAEMAASLAGEGLSLQVCGRRGLG
jgi:phosphomannomutase